MLNRNFVWVFLVLVFFTTNLQAGIVTVYDVAKGNTESSGSSSIYFGNTF
jgi:hypothetical protein